MEPCASPRKLCVFLALLAIFCFPGSTLANVATEVVVNKSVLLNLQKPSDRVSIAAPDIAELVVISPTQLQVNGKKIGTTTLIVWERGGKTSFFDIRVKGDTSLLQTQIQEVAPNDSITVDYANDTIVLSGKAANEQTVARAVQLAQAYAAKAEGPAPGAGPADPPSESSQTYPPTSDAAEKEGNETKNENKTKVLNHIVIDDPQQVVLEVKVAQVDKTALKALGLSSLVKGSSAEGFSNLVGAPSGEVTIKDALGREISKATGIAGTVPGLASIQPLDPFQLGASVFKPGIGVVLKALATKNMAKILAEPNLLVRSGQVGKFHAGSSIPYAVIAGFGATSTTTIVWKDVGVKLTFKPEVLEDGQIALKIDPAEVSSISGTFVGGYPIIDIRQVHTKVQLGDGESLVLAGLLQEDAIKSMSKIPLLGDIPILGALFRSTQEDIRQKELIFVITPRIAAVTPEGMRLPLPTDRPLTPEQEKEFQWIPFVK